MVPELFRALLIAGVPVALASYLLVWWALRQRYIGPVSTLREAELGIKRLSKEMSAAKKRRKKNKPDKRRKAADSAPGPADGSSSDLALQGPATNPFHGKWLAFGGGFYGVVGLLTYGVVELGELRDFFLGFESFSALFAHLGLDMLISLVIGAVKNFVVAIAWPVYWLSGIRSDYIWIWFVVAYAAYWAGARFAVYRAASGQPSDDVR